MFKTAPRLMAFGLVLAGSTAALPLVSQAEPVKPPYQNLLTAKQLVVSVTGRVQLLISRTAGGRGGDTYPPIGRGDDGGDHLPYPNRPGFPGGGPILRLNGDQGDALALDEGVVARGDASLDAAPDDNQENDFAAGLALQGMGHGLFELGQLVDQATWNYNNPSFWMYWNQACFKAGALLGANQGAKVAASLPAPGFITPGDFVPNDQELQAVRQQLFCP